MELSYPRVKRRPDGHFYVEFVLGSRRIRLLNGQKIKLNLKPNSYPPKQRKGKAEYFDASGGDSVDFLRL